MHHEISDFRTVEIGYNASTAGYLLCLLEIVEFSVWHVDRDVLKVISAEVGKVFCKTQHIV
jgi:hypothetical protein